MSTVAPPPQAPQPLPAQVQAQLTATVETPPDALVKLAVGAKLDAQVLAQLTQGKLQVQTPAGPVTLETPLAPPKDASLVLQVLAKGAALKLQIVSVDGTPAQAFARAAAQAQPAPGGVPAGGTQAAAQPQGVAQVSLTVGSTVTARLLTPGTIQTAPGQPAQAGTGSAQQGAQAAGSTAANPATGTVTATLAQRLGRLGGQVRALVGGQTGAAAGARPSASGAPAGTTQAGSAATGPGNTQGAQQAATSVPAGSALRVTVVSLTPPQGVRGVPQAPVPGAQPLVVGQTLAGVVTGTTATGQAVVQTAAGAIALPGSAPPTGTQVTVRLDGAPQPPLEADGFDPAQLARAHLRAASWPALSDAVARLEAADPALAHQVTTAVLPNLAQGSGLAASILMFLGALKGGDARAVFGDAALRALDRTRPGSSARLDGDVKGMARAGDETQQAGDWRATVVPAMGGHEIHPIRILTRDGGGEDGDEDDAPGGSRFVVDVTFDRLGRIQLDGTVPEGGKRLDLIVRSERRLPGVMQQDIRGIVAGAAALTGLSGGLSFQADPRAFVEIEDGGEGPGRPAVGITV